MKVRIYVPLQIVNPAKTKGQPVINSEVAGVLLSLAFGGCTVVDRVRGYYRMESGPNVGHVVDDESEVVEVALTLDDVLSGRVLSVATTLARMLDEECLYVECEGCTTLVFACGANWDTNLRDDVNAKLTTTLGL